MESKEECSPRSQGPSSLRSLIWKSVLALSAGVLVGCSSGSTAPTSDGPPEATLPDAPTDLQVTPLSATGLRLTWTDASDDETGFRIHRGPGGGEEIGTVDADVTSYDDTGLEPDTEYAYTVESFNEAGTSTGSPSASGRTLSEAVIVLSGSAVTFEAEEGGEDPPGQEIGVSNGGEEALTDLAFDVEYVDGQPTGWLTVSLDATSAPATLTLDAGVGSLAAGSYEATVFVRSSTASNTPQTVNVTFAVQAPPGDPASLRDVVISEVNWFGNGSDSGDEWIELRNVSGTTLDLSGWILEGAGPGGEPLVLDDGIQLTDGEYLLLAELQGEDIDGERTSLTGVSGVHLHSVELANSGEILYLRDVEGSLIDRTPTGSWAAGDEILLLSMERLDDITGGGYTAGDQVASWYTWNADDGRDTTHPSTADQGTPGADNTDPTAAAASPAPPGASAP